MSPNSIDAVSNRDFVLDYLSAAATCATHLSQLGAEIVLWSSEEFGFCEVSDAWASGSSIMPQKKNPDAAELLRAKAPRIVGHLSALHGVMHALPLTYNKDLQEDKEHLFDAVDTLEAVAAGGRAGCSRSIDVPARARWPAAAADEFPAATDVADALVRQRRPVPRVARHRRRPRPHGDRAGQAAVRARRRRSSPRSRPQLDGAASTTLLSTAAGSSRRSPRAAPRSSACASSSTQARAAIAGGGAR